MIAKLQRPLNDQSHPWMFYTEGHRNVCQLDRKLIPPEVVHAMCTRGVNKIYLEVEIKGKEITFGKVVEQQEW